MGVLSSRKLLVYEIEPLNESLNNADEGGRVPGQPILTLEIKKGGETYDRILAAHLNEDDLESSSWLFLSSKQFEHVHLVKFSDYIPYQAIDQSGHKSLGGKFLHSEHSILFRVARNSKPKDTIWENMSAIFTQDGSKAVLQTDGETYELSLKADNDLSYDKVPHLSGKRVQCYRRGSDSILFCEQHSANQ